MSNSIRCLFASALITGIVSLGAPASATPGGPAIAGGGCHMVTSPSSTGLTAMMTHASGTGSAGMVDMLSFFSPEPFCGV
jgi:hypothetical protein